jgi:hypothetical protein
LDFLVSFFAPLWFDGGWLVVDGGEGLELSIALATVAMPVAPAVALKRIAAANNGVLRMSSLPVRVRTVNTGILAVNPGACFLSYPAKPGKFPADYRNFT